MGRGRRLTEGYRAMKKYYIEICYSGLMSFEIDAETEHEACGMAIADFDNTTDSEIVYNLCEIDFGKCFEIEEANN